MRNLILGLVACLMPFSGNAQVKKPDTIAVGIFDRMSDVIGELSSISFTLKVRNDEVDQDLGLVTKFSESQVNFNGPSQMQIHSYGDKGHRGFWFSGESLVFYSFEENNYAIIDSPSNTLDMINEVNDKYGIDFPAADFFSPTFTDDILTNFDDLKYVGKRVLEGKECFYIIAKRADMIVQFWIANDALNLPVKMLIMEVAGKDSKQYEATFSNWDINPFLPDAMFKFQTPPKAKKISILPRK
ncbi:DUF2092 domain-containing protein [Flavobacterium sp.]|uniref:DUF2092 domain-containing protein n=1 Tax=Flavobacterium sp. TaxID=239 RepID=UPI0025BBC1BE|nr:DUF2092 domain-containing protein [Flavobacterium sp.]